MNNKEISKPNNSVKYALLMLGVTLVLMTLCRLLFYFFNYSEFKELNFSELTKIFIVGTRFDAAILALVNAPFVFFYFFPINVRHKPGFLRVSKYCFIFLNVFAIALNLIDTIYFEYTGKRSTSELFQFFGGGNENVTELMWSFTKDFWYMFLIWLGFVFLVFLVAEYSFEKIFKNKATKSFYLKNTSRLLISAVILATLFRGGFQYRPISLITASKYTQAKYTPLVTNTPFVFVHYYLAQGFTPKYYFENLAEADKYFNPVQTFKPSSGIFNFKTKNPNVLIIILEGISCENIGFFEKKDRSLTPFIDSLLSKSITYKGFANGKRSIESLPSILSSIPSLMDNDLLTSRFSYNSIEGIGNTLEKHGYKTMFFHGGNNGTMNFDAFANNSGFSKYFGRSQYHNDSDFDGNWGIFDEPFLKFSCEKISQTSEPFSAVIYTLSSHHPYTIPKEYENEFREINSKAEKSIAYSDMALRKFFECAEKENWYKNTLFIITADHTHSFGNKPSPWYQTNLGGYSVPIAFYSPTLKKGEYLKNEIAQQIDIFPSLLSILNVKDSVFAFGRNLFDKNSNPFMVNYINGTFHYLTNEYYLQFNGENPIALYSKNDTMQKINILKENSENIDEMTLRLKSIIHHYNHAIFNNKLTTLKKEKH